MKRVYSILFILALVLVLFTACTNEPLEENPTQNQPNVPSTPNNPILPNNPNLEEATQMFITINGNKIEVELAKNSSVDALVERLKKGDITYTANDYGGFEKVGNLGFSLPTSNTEITTQAGDVILYAGNQIVLFYGSNTWSYTRLGKIQGYSASELSSLLGAGLGSIQVTISVN